MIVLQSKQKKRFLPFNLRKDIFDLLALKRPGQRLPEFLQPGDRCQLYCELLQRKFELLKRSFRPVKGLHCLEKSLVPLRSRLLSLVLKEKQKTVSACNFRQNSITIFSCALDIEKIVNDGFGESQNRDDACSDAQRINHFVLLTGKNGSGGYGKECSG